MSQKFHNAGRTYAVGMPETDAELSARLAAARARDAIYAESAANGHDFGVVEYVDWTGDRRALGGHITQLAAAGMLTVEGTVRVDGQTLTQYVLTPAGLKHLAPAGKLVR